MEENALAILECTIFALLGLLVGIVLGQRFRALVWSPPWELATAIDVATFSRGR